MARGRRHHGRSTSANAGHVTRTGAIVLASWSPGRGAWQESHERKTDYLLYCEALRQERGLFRGFVADGSAQRIERRGVYGCRYGDHWLIDTASTHWHIGRPSRRRT